MSALGENSQHESKESISAAQGFSPKAQQNQRTANDTKGTEGSATTAQDAPEETLSSLLSGYGAWLQGCADVAQLEGRLVAIAATRMLAMGVGVVMLAVSAWMLVLAAAGALAWQVGVPPALILLVAALACLALGWWLWQGVVRNARRLRFDHTISQFTQARDEEA